jgi:hypothetical protein
MNNNYTYRGVCHSQKSNSSLDREASLPKMYRGSQYLDLPSAQKVDKENTYRGVKYVA